MFLAIVGASVMLFCLASVIIACTAKVVEGFSPSEKGRCHTSSMWALLAFTAFGLFCIIIFIRDIFALFPPSTPLS